MKLLYLASEYPAFSHTFIQREIQALRAEGIEVATASVRRPQQIDRMTPTDRQEYEDTCYLRDNLFLRGMKASFKVFFRHPLAFSLLKLRAMQWCLLNGPKSYFKAVAYILEAGILLNHMHDKGIRHVHVHFANPAATVAMIAAGSGLIEFSVSAHGPDIFYDTRENLLALKAERAVFVRCISHYCVSQFMRITPASLWSKLRIVRCGVDTTAFAPAHDKGMSESDTAERGLRILCLGRICPAKAQPLLLKAFLSLRGQGTKARLTFAGGGEGLEELRGMAARSPYSKDITFTGAVDQDTARNLYDQADIFVLPSVAEGVPVVLMEAMAKEVPCIATNITGIPELIEHGEDGLLAIPGSEESLLDCLSRLCADANYRGQLGKAGRRKVLRIYDLATNGKAMVRLFKEMLPDKGAAQ